jgi:hypothetical protein
MTRLNNSTDLEEFIVEMAQVKKNWTVVPNLDTTSELNIRLAFGRRLLNDPVVSSSYFREEGYDLTIEEQKLSQSMKDEPREKYNAKVASKLQKDKPVRVNAFLDRMYLDNQSPVFHGFLNEMRTLMGNTLKFENKLYQNLVEAGTFPPQDQDSWNKLMSFLIGAKQLENLTLQKDKFPPILGQTDPPTLLEWKRTELGRSHRNGVRHGSNSISSSSGGHLRDQRGAFENRNVRKVTGETEGRIGIIEIDTGKAITKINYNEHRTEGSDEVDLNITMLEIVGKAKRWMQYDNTLQERAFFVTDGTTNKEYTSFTKEELGKLQLGKLLKMMHLPKGHIMCVIAAVQDRTDGEDESAVALSVS